jgi:hypothetical protein
MRACPSNLTTLGAALPQINLVEQLILEIFLRWNSQKSQKSSMVDFLEPRRRQWIYSQSR